MRDAQVEASDDPREGTVIAVSRALSKVLEDARMVAPTPSTVLIHGETGTGKGVIARAIHDASGRPGGFVQVNCAAIPMSLIESELMGHERGAFTGAVAQRTGRFEVAKDGTIFLDEIGELPLQVQPKLLRILQDREFERVGGSRTLRTNARVVAATNRDLRAMVAAGTFREDLYYRLSVFPVTVPPLRERIPDIVELARHFTRAAALRLGKPVPQVDDVAIGRLLAHGWPGNVRELQNVIERSVILSRGKNLELEPWDCFHAVLDPCEIVVDAAGALRSGDAPAKHHSVNGAERLSSEFGSETLAEVNRAHILRVLDTTNWVIGGPNGAAAKLGVKRSTLIFRMRKLGIVRPGRVTQARTNRAALRATGETCRGCDTEIS